MKKVFWWIVIFGVAVAGGAIIGMRFWEYGEVRGAIIAGLGGCVLMMGVLIGAGWTFVMMREGARLGGPTQVANARLEAERLRALREAIQVWPGNGQAGEPPGSDRLWLPPLNGFDVIDVENVEE